MTPKTLFFLAFVSGTAAFADPLLDSWYTADSGRYARIYETTEAESAQSTSTTWSRGQGTQALPTYAGIHEISFTDNWVYLRTTGLAGHIMGPWYLNEARTNLFPNYPANTSTLFRIPRNPTIPVEKTGTGLGAIGYYVNGVAMFDSRDAFSYSNSEGADATPNGGFIGDGIWNRDAFVNESVTFDAANAHQAGQTYHYHANSPGLRHTLGDNVDYSPATNTYTENFQGTHSPILGWAEDGLPVYGPYAYSDPNDPTSAVRRMTSGYRPRDITARTSLPQWAADFQDKTTATLPAGQQGPPVSNAFPVGRYIEDYELTGTGDLDRHNSRFAVTPEFPEGVRAYHISIEADGTPVFPYAVGREFAGDPTGGNVRNLNESPTIFFEGGPEKEERNLSLDVEDDVTLVWDIIEGGSYTVQSGDDLDDFTGTTGAIQDADILTYTETAEPRKFYRTARPALAAFDDEGFVYEQEERIRNNILLLIVDDWGTDSSPLDNSTTLSPGTSFPPLPNLTALAETGLRFTNAYAQPICSPTRATIITGRQPFRHGVGNPTTNNTLPADELTIPELMAATAPDYALASFGKWHLGGGDTGPADLGGWPLFAGILQGGVPNYQDWTKVENGITTNNVTTYTTTDQVDDAVQFIAAQGDTPWFTWMGFNAPHTPFHNPPSDLQSYPVFPTNGDDEVTGANRRAAYEAAMEALDTEIGRLLQSVDLAKTNVIVIGDNGTPGQVVQAPFGNGHAKGDLFQGGIRVPFFAAGPDIASTGTTDRLVHCVDLFSTILDLTGTAPPATEIDSQTLVPIFLGQATAERSIVAEKFGDDAGDNGRAILSESFPDYKLIIFGDREDASDQPVFAFYDIAADPNEDAPPLDLSSLTETEQSAYDFLRLIDTQLGGGYSDPPTNEDTIYIRLPNQTGSDGVPGNANVDPIEITINGQTADYEDRFDTTNVYDQFWVKATISPATGGPYNTATVTFPNNPNTGEARAFTAVEIVTNP